MNDDEVFDTGESADSEPSDTYAAKKRRIVLLLLAYSVVLGIFACFVAEDDAVRDFIVGLPILILGVWWCFTDAAEHNHRIGRLMKLLLVLLFIVGLPIYLLQTRGFGAIKTFALVMVLVGAMCGCMLVTAIATMFVGEVTGLWEVAY